jgi:hypothetical protein
LLIGVLVAAVSMLLAMVGAAAGPGKPGRIAATARPADGPIGDPAESALRALRARVDQRGRVGRSREVAVSGTAMMDARTRSRWAMCAMVMGSRARIESGTVSVALRGVGMG